MSRHRDAVELLDRALAYTRGALLDVRDEHLVRATPCARWDLDALLHHMDDALDAFTEAAAGSIGTTPGRPGTLGARVGLLQAKACALLGAWSAADHPPVVALGDAVLPSTTLVQAAALEITVHGWDVAQACGGAVPVPDGLAAALLPVARALVPEEPRGEAFAPPSRTTAGADASEELLAFLGRRPGSAPPPRAQHTAAPARR